MEQALAGGDLFADDVADAGAALVVVHGALHAAGLVQDEVLHVLVDHHARAVDADDRDVRVDADALAGDDLAVDLDAAFVDEARGDAGLGQHLLQAHAFAVVSSAAAVAFDVLVSGGAGLGDVVVPGLLGLVAPVSVRCAVSASGG